MYVQVSACVGVGGGMECVGWVGGVECLLCMLVCLSVCAYVQALKKTAIILKKTEMLFDWKK